jgi:hypothetical protein
LGLAVNHSGQCNETFGRISTLPSPGKNVSGTMTSSSSRINRKRLRPVEPATIFKHFKSPRRGARGRAWLDAKDSRIRRWVDDMMVVDDEITTAAVHAVMIRLLVQASTQFT